MVSSKEDVPQHGTTPNMAASHSSEVSTGSGTGMVFGGERRGGGMSL